ncbi:uncharacterized protein JCM10292_001085 [Rhodotorula paludigena]|uniref:uncharacterized protein n=1 Tax=Rhodotorula paludigena TaxID=86838 RepID=UPI003170D225
MVRSSAAGYTALASPDAPVADDPEAPAAASPDPFLSSAISLAGREAVFSLVQRIRHEIEDVVDSPLSFDQLKSPTINFSVVRPLTVKLTRGDRPAISLIYGLLLARAHFLERSDDDLAFAAVNTSRADLCELLAIKALSAYGVAPGSLELLHVLTTAFNPFAGATVDMFPPDEEVDEEELQRLEEFGKGEATNALELAIVSKAKRFVKSPLVQQVIKAISVGEIMYTPESNHALIQDNYKSRPVVELYDWRSRPFLDHHRLRVPQIRSRLEFLTFAIMLGLFLLTEATYSLDHVNLWEALFIAWALGFSLDEWSAIQENGLTLHFGGAFNVLDASFCLVFFAYLGLRIAGLRGLEIGDTDLSALSFDTLGLAGVALFPRLTISLLKHNVVLLALSKMIREFSVFMGLAFLTASGFLCTFRILSRGTWDVGHIAWLMLKIWLGSAFLGFDAAQQFHPVYGPALMVAFAVLSQTLLLTILISLLSNTFAAVQANAETEILNQMALRTIERAKADPLTLYMPPLNIAALILLFPLRFLTSPRVLHKTQVYLARLFNLPILLFLALSTRARHHKRSTLYLASQRTQRAFASLPRGVVPMWEDRVDLVVGEVFERAVTAKGRKVDSIDAADAASEGGDAAGAKQAKRRAPPPSPLKQHRRAAGGEALGSLSSPLARIFGQGALLDARPEGADGERADKGGTVRRASDAKREMEDRARAGGSGEGGDAALEARLARIEEALQVLVGEVVKSGAVGQSSSDGEGKGKEVPLTSLTGEVEQSYAD